MEGIFFSGREAPVKISLIEEVFMRPFLIVTIIMFSMYAWSIAGIVKVPQDQLSIQAGINAAVNGDTVLVADSIYYENINFMGKAITVASYMIIDKDATHRDSTIINGSQPRRPDSGSVVSFASGEDTTSVIYGFTITGGTGTVSGDSRIGGGVYCYLSGARISHNKIIFNTVNHTNKCDGGGIGFWPRNNNVGARYIIVEDNIIESNSITSSNTAISIQGGGIHIVKGRISGNIIRHNSVSGQPIFAGGGGIAAGCEDTATRTLVVISGNTITHNQVTTPGQNGGWGGGIDAVFCNVQISDNHISNNQAGGSQGFGGGIRLWRSKNISYIKNNTVSSNSSDNGGGLEIYNTSSVQIIDNNFIENYAKILGGGIYDTETSGTVISGNEFIGNSTDPNYSAGGGVQCYLSNEITITGNLFKQNSAYQCGGVGSQDSDLLLTNNLFTQNQAYEAGAIGVSQFWPTLRIVKIINNTITGNEADIAGGIELEEALELKVLNNICWGNSATFAPEIYVKGGTMDIAYSDTRLGADSIKVGSGATLNWLAGNVDTDPLFESGDTLYHLSSASPCINVGIDSLLMGSTMVKCPPDDYDGDSRPMGPLPDMGADEFFVVGIEPKPIAGIPNSYALYQNYPNPFNPTTNIEFSIPKSEFVTLKIYNVLGEEVATLVSERLTAGRYNYDWPARSSGGDASGMASGVYFYKLGAGVFVQTKKMLLIK
jgi:hypothetical protein